MCGSAQNFIQLDLSMSRFSDRASVTKCIALYRESGVVLFQHDNDAPVRDFGANHVPFLVLLYRLYNSIHISRAPAPQLIFTQRTLEVSLAWSIADLVAFNLRTSPQVLLAILHQKMV